jgi:hypothetical protein
MVIQHNFTQPSKVISHNGIKENTALNKLADKLDNVYKNSKNMVYVFELGVDGQWEMIIKNTKLDKGICLKQHPTIKDKQYGFIYSTSIKNQSQHDFVYDIKNNDLLIFVKRMFNAFYKMK